MHFLGLVHGHFVATRFVSLTEHGRDPFNQNFRKFRSKTQWIGSVQPEVSEKLVHLNNRITEERTAKQSMMKS